jgi:CubicO group peptidase (beta-lactamase class C family)
MQGDGSMATNRRVFLSSALTLATSFGRSQSAATNGGRDACASSTGGSVVEPTTDQIKTTVQGYAPPAGVGAAVGVASPSFGAKIVCIGSLDDQSGNSMAFTTDTPFEIASITKTFTASIYESFVLRGRIRSSDTLGRFIRPEINSKIQAIPLIDLANYTSGLPADNVNFDSWPSSAMGDYTDSEMFSYLRNPPFAVGGTGQVETYSNLGFSLLAVALEAAAREDGFGPLCCKQILGPLGMVKTQPYGGRIGGQLPRGFDTDGNVASPGWAPFPAYDGAGALISTPNDMMTWLQFNMGIIQAGSLSDILPVTQAPAAPGATLAAGGASGISADSVPGLGWFISKISNESSVELTVIQKNGDLAGFSSQMAFLPGNGCTTSNAGIFVLTNWQNSTVADNIAYDLLFVMAGLQPPTDKSRYPRAPG